MSEIISYIGLGIGLVSVILIAVVLRSQKSNALAASDDSRKLTEAIELSSNNLLHSIEAEGNRNQEVLRQLHSALEKASNDLQKNGDLHSQRIQDHIEKLKKSLEEATNF